MPSIGPVEVIICLVMIITMTLVISLIVWVVKRLLKPPAAQAQMDGVLPPASVIKENPTERLQQLQSLLERGLITQDEYDKKRAEILERL